MEEVLSLAYLLKIKIEQYEAECLCRQSLSSQARSQDKPGSERGMCARGFLQIPYTGTHLYTGDWLIHWELWIAVVENEAKEQNCVHFMISVFHKYHFESWVYCSAHKHRYTLLYARGTTGLVYNM